MKTTDSTMISALAKLTNDIQCDDGIANACIAEAAQRLREHVEELDRLRHERAVYIGGLEAVQEENARLRAELIRLTGVVGEIDCELIEDALNPSA